MNPKKAVGARRGRRRYLSCGARRAGNDAMRLAAYAAARERDKEKFRIATRDLFAKLGVPEDNLDEAMAELEEKVGLPY